MIFKEGYFDSIGCHADCFPEEEGGIETRMKT